jgi:acyl carrier protein phosphodiesterase
MKTSFAKAAGLSLVLGMMLNTGLFAQNNPNTNSTPSSSSTKTATTVNRAPLKPAKATTHREETKEQWLKHYNEMKPKVDALSSKAKMETKDPALTAEVTKLNRMEGDYKARIENWDKITPDKRDAYISELRTSHKALNEQYEKTKHMWDKMHPAAEKKAEPAKETSKN